MEGKELGVIFGFKIREISYWSFYEFSCVIGELCFNFGIGSLGIPKRREIGLLQAIGFSRREVRLLFFKIGLSLSACGIMMGVLIGSGLSYWIEKHPLNVLPDIYYDSQIPAYLDLQFVLVVVAAATTLAILGSYFSTRGALTVMPSEAIRKH